MQKVKRLPTPRARTVTDVLLSLGFFTTDTEVPT